MNLSLKPKVKFMLTRIPGGAPRWPPQEHYVQKLEFGFLEEMILGFMEASEVCKHSL